ncbi:MAG: DUF1592 domain-containing protein [Myxococcales bacterium]|nr:DUF1592 domain-containing protein [Myxococcales bacterium]MCB9532717.1 DUF1592 domain-containing protein [Myxococcales bacterium]
MRRTLSLAVCASASLVLACAEDGPGDRTDVVDPADAADAADTAGDDAGEVEVGTPAEYPTVAPGPVSARRLTNAQFAHVLRDVFGDIVLPELAEPDVNIGGLLAVGASGASFSARGVESMEEAAFAIAEQVIGSVELREQLVPCAADPEPGPGCAEGMVRSVGRRLWRRPLSDAEVARLDTLAADAAATLGTYDDGLVYAIAALLQSPNFLFRAELGTGEPGDRHFDDWDLASRLSFFLWDTCPDEALLDAAAAGELSTETGLRASVERMIADPRTRRGMRSFFSEYLQLYELDTLRKDPTIFEHFSTLLGPDAREETLLLMEHIVFDEDTDFRDILTTRETYVNPRLAALYRIPAPVPDGFGLVRLPADTQRAGLLGHASFLANHAHQVSSSATLRGVAVRQTLLCASIPPPPVNVDTSIPEPSGEAPTLRDRVAEHLENDTCRVCHLLTDPIGLGLENFDGIGRWRDTDGGAAIDPSGDLNGVVFANPIELGEAVRNHPDFPWCVARTLTRYATGRVEERDELALIDVTTERFAASGYSFSVLLEEVAMSPMFRNAGDLR